MQDYGFRQIDLLKIDIEGAEQQIFNDEPHLAQFLPSVRFLILEVHDEFIDSQNICNILSGFHFTCKTIQSPGMPDVIIAGK